MKIVGRNSVYSLHIKGEFIHKGTQTEIANVLGITVLNLRNKINRYDYYELTLIKDSRIIYEAINNGNVLARGTIKEISEIINYSYYHVNNVRLGNKGSKNFSIREAS